jgi:hypothetical protein
MLSVIGNQPLLIRNRPLYGFPAAHSGIFSPVRSSLPLNPMPHASSPAAPFVYPFFFLSSFRFCVSALALSCSITRDVPNQNAKPKFLIREDLGVLFPYNGLPRHMSFVPYWNKPAMTDRSNLLAFN